MTRKFALVIGNSHYADPALARLKAPEADVHALASVLRDPAVGGFDEVQELIDEPEHAIRRAIAAFFANKAPSDLMLLYASGHGVLDDQGRLYLATQDTQRDLLNATAIPTSFITDGMDTCRSKRQVLILDCCHSGAFARGAKGELTAITQATFEGNGFGRVVLTASDSTQYALEGDQVDQSVSLSLFTNYLLEGLTTGEADRGRDGWVDVDEWYDYAYEKILLQTSGQTPKKWAYNTQGELVIARNPRPKPVELPRYLRTAIGSELPRVRLEAVEQLENLLGNNEPGLASVATQELQRVAQEDDSLIVRKRAAEVLAAHAVTGSPPVEETASQTSQAEQTAQEEREKQQAQELLEKEQRRQADEEQRRREQEEIRQRQEQERQAQQAQQARAARLETLYNSVLSKMQAGEWGAAQASLEELQRAHPGYGEADKLQKKIAVEIARQKSEWERQEQQARQRRLEAQYQDASQAMGQEDWLEAQHLFQELAKEAPGYRDVNKQLRVIAGRMSGEQAAAATQGGWLPVLAVSLGWGIAYTVLIPLVEAYRYDNIYLVAIIPALLIAGGVVYSLVLAGLPLSRARLVQLFLLWWVGSALSIGVAVYPDWQDNLVMTAVIPNVLMLPTFAGTGLLLRTYKPSLRWISVLGGWAVALIVDFVITDSILVNYGFSSMEAASLTYGVVGLAVGAIGGGWMHRQLRPFSTLAGESRASSSEAGEPRTGALLAASTWLPVLTMGLGWGIAWAVLSPLFNSDQIFLGAVIPALFMAASTVAAINMVSGNRVSQRRLAQLFGLWWVGLILTLGFAANPDWQGITVPDIVIPIALLLLTFAGTGLLLRASLPSVSWASTLGGLAIGLIVGAFATLIIRPAFPYADLHIFGLHDLGGMPVLGFGGLVGGLISGGWMRWQLSKGV